MSANVGTAPLFLVRHARTALNAGGRLRGHLDPPLDEVGRGEARRLAAALPAEEVTTIVCSPLRRARETASAIGARYRAPVLTDPRLIDRDYGRWAGVRTAEVIHRFGSLDRAPDVEPADAVLARALIALQDAVTRAHGRTVVVVAHDVVNRLLLASLLTDGPGASAIAQHTACWNVLRYAARRWRVEAVNQVAPDDPGGA